MRAIVEKAQDTSSRDGVVNNLSDQHRGTALLAKLELVADADLTCWIYEDIP